MGEHKNIIYDKTTDIWYLIPIFKCGRYTFIDDNKEVIFIGDKRHPKLQKEDLIDLILKGDNYTKYYTQILVSLMVNI